MEKVKPQNWPLGGKKEPRPILVEGSRVETGGAVPTGEWTGRSPRQWGESIRSNFSGLWGLGAPVAGESWGSTSLAYQWGLREMPPKLRDR